MSQARAEQAERLLADEVLNEAFKAVLDEQIVNWIKSPVEAADKRETYYLIAVAVDRVRGKLASFVADAKLDAAKAR